MAIINIRDDGVLREAQAILRRAGYQTQGVEHLIGTNNPPVTIPASTWAPLFLVEEPPGRLFERPRFTEESRVFYWIDFAPPPEVLVRPGPPRSRRPPPRAAAAPWPTRLRAFARRAA